jgi:mRNA interferase MazF
MLNSGDVVDVDLGVPTGSEAGLLGPAVVVTAQGVLTRQPTVVQVVPLTRTLRGYETEVVIAADDGNGLTADLAAQCQHIRAIAHRRVRERLGNVGPAALAQVRDTLAILLDT